MGEGARVGTRAQNKWRRGVKARDPDASSGKRDLQERRKVRHFPSCRAWNNPVTGPFADESGREPLSLPAARGWAGFLACSVFRRQRQRRVLGEASNPGLPREWPRRWGGAQRERVDEQRAHASVAGGASSGVSRWPSCRGFASLGRRQGVSFSASWRRTRPSRLGGLSGLRPWHPTPLAEKQMGSNTKRVAIP